jgi:hypothetical protein
VSGASRPRRRRRRALMDQFVMTANSLRRLLASSGATARPLRRRPSGFDCSHQSYTPLPADLVDAPKQTRPRQRRGLLVRRAPLGRPADFFAPASVSNGRRRRRRARSVIKAQFPSAPLASYARACWPPAEVLLCPWRGRLPACSSCWTQQARRAGRPPGLNKEPAATQRRSPR